MLLVFLLKKEKSGGALLYYTLLFAPHKNTTWYYKIIFTLRKQFTVQCMWKVVSVFRLPVLWVPGPSGLGTGYKKIIL